MLTGSLEKLKELSSLVSTDFKESGSFNCSCELLALSIAEKFLDEGKIPRLYRLRRFETIDGKRQKVKFFHLGLPKPQRFMSHVICVHEGNVYDPMMGEAPLPIKEYYLRAFEKTTRPNHSARIYKNIQSAFVKPAKT